MTGATSGTSFSTTRPLAEQDATVRGSERGPCRGTKAANKLRRAAGHERIEFTRMDHPTAAANQAATEEPQSWPGHLDVLGNNAGGLVPSPVTGHGHEPTEHTESYIHHTLGIQAGNKRPTGRKEK